MHVINLFIENRQFHYEYLIVLFTIETRIAIISDEKNRTFVYNVTYVHLLCCTIY